MAKKPTAPKVKHTLDPDSVPGKLVFNRMITFKDTWAKIEQKQGRA